jgi:pyruvate kinase
MSRPYALIVTLGPATSSASDWEALLAAGATAFRLNTSHLTLPELADWTGRLGKFFAARADPPALVLDLQGSKWRLGTFTSRALVEGTLVALVCGETADQTDALPVPHADFFRAAPHSGREITLNDAKIRLLVEGIDSSRITARVVQGGEIRPRKGITFLESDYRVEALGEKDQAILRQAARLPAVQFAISYIRDRAEMQRYRALFDELVGPRACLIAKLERGPAMEQAATLAGLANELWVCRGDLGAELGLAGMARAVHRFSPQVAQIQAPVIMAGQVLEHMTGEPAPTRSEICYLHDALALGYRGFVLSDETAIGRYPVESVRAAAMFQSRNL